MLTLTTRRLIKTLSLLLIPIIPVYGQISKCGTAAPSISSLKVQADMDPVNKGAPKRVIRRSGDNHKYEYAIAVHFVLDPQLQDTITFSRFDNQIKQVNQAFQGADLRFKLSPKQVKRIEVPSLSRFDYPSDEQQLFSNYRISNQINVFCVESIRTVQEQEVWQGYTYHPEHKGLAPYQENVIVITFSAITEGNTLIHEFGHFFGLYHTHEGYDDPQRAEQVSERDCLNRGDLICDTPADPNLNRRVDASDPANCKCDLTDLSDPNGLAYNPLIENFMSYAPPICRKSFTTGQLNRMNEYHLFVRSKLKHEVIRNRSQTHGGGTGSELQVVRSLSTAQARSRLEGRFLALVFIYDLGHQWAKRTLDELGSPTFSHYFSPEENSTYYLVATSLDELGDEQGVRDFLGNTLAPSASVIDHPFLQRLWPEIAPTPGLYIVKFDKEWLTENQILFSHPGYLKPLQLKEILNRFGVL